MRATLIIIKSEQILLIHRFNKWREFYVFPGWWIEDDETAEEAAIREAKEETNFNVVLDKKLWEYMDDYSEKIHHVFLIKEFSWIMQLNWPEVIKNSETNRYILEWHDIDKISSLPLKPEWLKEKVSEFFWF